MITDLFRYYKLNSETGTRLVNTLLYFKQASKMLWIFNAKFIRISLTKSKYYCLFFVTCCLLLVIFQGISV